MTPAKAADLIRTKPGGQSFADILTAIDVEQARAAEQQDGRSEDEPYVTPLHIIAATQAPMAVDVPDDDNRGPEMLVWLALGLGASVATGLVVWAAWYFAGVM